MSLPEFNKVTDGIDITSVSRLKHAALYAASKKLGSQAAVARHLGVQQAEFGRWCNLRGCPSAALMADSQFEKKMFDLTGQTLDQLFPEELRRNAKFLKSPKSYERTRRFELAAIAAIAERSHERLEIPSPAAEAGRSEIQRMQAAAIKDLMNQLSDREREVVRLRFGLDGLRPLTLDAIGDKIGISRTRVAHIEKKAMTKLQRPKNCANLIEYLE